MLLIPEYYTVLILEVFVMRNLHIFGSDNINRRMYCSSIGIVIGNRNVIYVGYDIERYL